MKSKEIIDSLLESVDILIKKRISNSSFNTTIVGQIVKGEDPNIPAMKNGKIVIDYFGVRLLCYNNINLDLKPNDTVYILVPNNDLSNDKFIIGKK